MEPQPQSCSSKSGNHAGEPSATRQFQAVLDAATELSIIATDPQGLITLFNRGAENMLGYTAEEMVGKQTLLRLHLASEVAQRGLELGREISGFSVFVENSRLSGVDKQEWTCVRKDGSHLPVCLTITIIRDDQGAVSGFLGIAEDLTELKEAERVRDELAEKEHAAADEALRANTIFLNTLLNSLPLPVFYKDSKFHYIGLNNAYEEFIGKSRVELLGKSVFDIAPRELAEVYHAKDLELLRGLGTQVYESQVKDMHGVMHDVVFHKATFMDSDGRTIGLIGAILDITERKRNENALIDSRQQLMDIIDFLPDATFVLDNDKRVIAWNRAIEEMTGISKSEMLGQGDYAHSVPFYGVRRQHLLDLLDFDDKELEDKYSYVVREENMLHAESFAPALYGGKGAWIWIYGAPLYNTKGERIGAIEAVRDITERKRLQEMLSQQAHTDQMTGVNNRGYFLEMLDVEIERASRYGHSFCVLMLDLDHFKSVNDTRGHAAGDEAIRTVTRVLQSSGLRQSDILGRMGGDEFAVALPETTLKGAADAAERIRLQLAATPVSYAAENFSITVSIGVCEYRGGDSQETLLQRADQAMYEAKQAGRDRISVWYPD